AITSLGRIEGSRRRVGINRGDSIPQARTYQKRVVRARRRLSDGGRHAIKARSRAAGLEGPMDTPRLSTKIRRITVFDRDVTGSLRPVVLFDRRRKKKKQTKGLKPIERLVRSVVDANDAFGSTYAQRHRRSNRKRRDGWLKDMAANISKAGNKGRKELE